MNFDKMSYNLIYFIDTIGDEEVIESLEAAISNGLIHIVERRFHEINEYIQSNPDRTELRQFVAYEMNRDFNDPTGERDFNWLISARDLMQSVLDEAKEKSSA